MDLKFDLHKPYVVRIQGYDFKKFRDHFHKPYDPNFFMSMLQTASDLLSSFQAKTFHVHAFQILLVFDGSEPKITDSPTKLLTLYTSFATVRFNHHIVEQMNNEYYISTYTPSQVAKVATKQAIFYGEFLSFDQLIDQCVHKSLGLAITMWAHDLLDVKEVKDVKTEELIKRLPVRWELDVPMFVSYGVFGKKQNIYYPWRAFRLRDDLMSMLLEHEWPDYFGGDRLKKESFYNVQTYSKDNNKLLVVNTKC